MIEVEGKARSYTSVMRALRVLDPDVKVRMGLDGTRLSIMTVLSAQTVLNALEEIDAAEASGTRSDDGETPLME